MHSEDCYSKYHTRHSPLLSVEEWRYGEVRGRERGRERNRETEIHRDKKIHRDTDTDKDGNREERGRGRDRQKNRQRQWENKYNNAQTLRENESGKQDIMSTPKPSLFFVSPLFSDSSSPPLCFSPFTSSIFLSIIRCYATRYWWINAQLKMITVLKYPVFFSWLLEGSTSSLNPLIDMFRLTKIP